MKVRKIKPMKMKILQVSIAHQYSKMGDLRVDPTDNNQSFDNVTSRESVSGVGTGDGSSQCRQRS
jgi:hypothetical protein